MTPAPVSPGDAAVCSGCPFCERADEHEHEFVDVLSADCDHELAKLRRELAEARSLPQASAQQAAELSVVERRVVEAALRWADCDRRLDIEQAELALADACDTLRAETTKEPA